MRENADQHPTDKLHPQLYIVGIGASAGGLKAIEQFLRHTPADTGLAYVIVQHLEPSRESMLPDLMRDWTGMAVTQVQDGMYVGPDKVYIIPPNYTLALMNGRLHLMTPSEPHFQWRPVDYFFRSLADDCAERAIAVIFSGAGTDGALGIKAVKGAGGLTIAQTPESATYPSMPQSAIETGEVDLILPLEEMASEILAYVDHAHTLQQHEGPVLPGEADHVWQKIFYLLRSHTGHDFSQYKQSTIRRRIERRMLVNRIDNLDDYVRYLQHQPREMDVLFGDLLIGVTHFFRDAEAFEALRKKAIRPLIRRKPYDETLRIWVNGCSTGEEAYSIAILVHEELAVQGRQHKVQVFATDINDSAIYKARRGEYSEGIAADVSPERLERFFERHDKLYRVKPLIRDSLVFAVHNALQDPPFSNVDLVSCRNLLIYLGSELQDKLVPLLHYALAPEGYAFLGSSETLGHHARLFKTVDAEARLFQHRAVPSNIQPSFDLQTRPVPHLEPPVRHKRIPMNKPLDLQEAAEKALLAHHTPPAVIVNPDGDIHYFSDNTGRYLEPTAGEANLNLLHLARQGLRLLLSNMVRKAARDQVEVVEHEVQVQVNDHIETIDLVVRPLDHGELDNLLLVVFERAATRRTPAQDAEGAAPGEIEVPRQRVLELERDLQNTREHLQATVEDLEISNEELTSANEELQSANEELQSTNEELTSAKEELQSVNEELLTVNSELEGKIDELSRANDDLRNLLTSVDIGIIFLDHKLRIMRYNPAATQFLNLREEDTDRPISHLVSRLDYDGLVDDAEEVLETLVAKEVEVRLGFGWHMLRMRPYRTSSNVIDGIIITISDISEQKHVQQNLRKLSRAIDQSTSLIVIMDVAGNIDYANQRFFEVTYYTEQELAGQPYHTLLAEGTETFRHEILDAVIQSRMQWQGELLHHTANSDTFWAAVTISPLTDEHHEVTHLIAVEEDITARKQLEQTLRERWTERAATSSSAPQMAVLVFDRHLQYVLGEGNALPGIGIRESDLEGLRAGDVLPSELERYYRAALRGDNVYFERESGDLRFGIQVMPVRDGKGRIIAGVVILWDIGHQSEDGEPGQR
ncbi:MAG: PAS domain-containing protein [Chloroflexi bacterium]|nr:PAS domain-containing protein [Chloroflexota bacterium]